MKLPAGFNVIATAADHDAVSIFTGGAVYDLARHRWSLPYMTNNKAGDGPVTHLAHLEDLMGPVVERESAIMPGFDPGIDIEGGYVIVFGHGGKVAAGVAGIHFVAKGPDGKWSAPQTWCVDGNGQSIECSVGPIGGGFHAVAYIHGNDAFDRTVRVRHVAGPVPALAPYSDAAVTGIGSGGNQVRATLRRLGDRGHVGCFHMVPDPSGPPPGVKGGGGPRKIGMASSTDYGISWAKPIVIASESGYDLTNPFGLRRKDGRVQCFYTRAGQDGGRALAYVESSDAGETWSKPEVASDAGTSRVVMVEHEDQVICYTALGDTLGTFVVEGV